jgi:hypothetical protein
MPDAAFSRFSVCFSMFDEFLDFNFKRSEVARSVHPNMSAFR